jgi:DNA-binding transcriptional LysR family regulator
MSETGVTEAEQLVREGRLDMAIVNHDNTLSNLFIFTPILETTLVGCVVPDHPLAWKRDVTIEMLKDEKLILFGQNAKAAQRILCAFAQEGIEPNVFMRSKQIYLIMQLVQKHGAVTFFMDELMKLQNDLAPFYLALPLCFTFGIIRRKDFCPSSDMVKFLCFCEGYGKGEHHS